jgi:hypothetical protein
MGRAELEGLRRWPSYDSEVSIATQRLRNDQRKAFLEGVAWAEEERSSSTTDEV